MNTDNNDKAASKADNENVKPSKYLLNDEVYKLLRSAQEEIRELTDITPSIRKLINELVTENNVDKVKERLIKTFN